MVCAKVQENSVHTRLKIDKFNKMLYIQDSFILESMKSGRNSVVWIFADKEYYHNDFELSLFYEFSIKARSLYEKKGYRVNGVVIKW